MNSKEIILNRIAGAAMPPVDYPAFDFTPLRFEDRTAAFAEAVGRSSRQTGTPLQS
jgi:L-lactate dehydrogenase complex protein LldG